MMKTGILHLIPNLLANDTVHKMPQYLRSITGAIRIFYVEELRSARRFLKALDKQTDIDTLTFHLLNEHENESLRFAESYLRNGQDIAYISEAGCPAVADPGQELVQLAHHLGVTVVPHIGPNAILLALMASGFNGQQFYFHGYLPNKQPMLSNKIKEIESHSRLNNCTQIFIETPYRNNQLLTELLKICHEHTMLCMAVDLTGIREKIISKPIKAWRKMDIDFHKIPAVFLLSAF